MRVRHFQIVADENFPRDAVVLIRKWTTIGQIGHELGHKGMDDEQIIPRLLLQVGRTTLITQDQGLFYEEPHPRHCIVVLPEKTLPLRLARLTRAVFRTEGFRTIAERMGKIARVSAGRARWREYRATAERFRRLAQE